MALQSMTGFARAGAELKGTAIAWEVKSVNGKGSRRDSGLPPGFERIEQPARQAIQKRFSRGNVQATLTVVHVGLDHAAGCQRGVSERSGRTGPAGWSTSSA